LDLSSLEEGFILFTVVLVLRLSTGIIDGADEFPDMHPGENRERAEEHLREALSAAEAEDKNYHVRQAIQLLELDG
jgi:uncharacterized membrane protein